MNKFYKYIPGWFDDDEAKCLYEFVKNTNGPMLEIGTFFGRSTSIICDGISDRDIEFDSYDINFKDVYHFKEFYKNVHGKDTDIPDILEHHFLNSNETILDVAKKNLLQYNLLQYVNLKDGNFHEILNKSYSLIFCDAMHDINEISLNLQKIVCLSNPGCIWLIHDVGQSTQLISEIINKSNVALLKTVSSLGVFRFIV